MFAVEKQIKGHKVEILCDYHGNGRLFIDEECICQFDFSREKNSSFIAAGWQKSPSDSHIRIQSGQFKGSPQMVEWCNQEKHLNEITLGDTIQHKGKLAYAPVKWIENAIELIIDGNFEELSKKKIASVSKSLVA